MGPHHLSLALRGPFLVLPPLVGQDRDHKAFIHSHQELCSGRGDQKASALALSVLIVGGFGWTTGKTGSRRAQSVQSARSMAAGCNHKSRSLFQSIYFLPLLALPRLRTDLCRIGLAIPLRLLGRWDDADPCNFNFSRPTQPSAPEGQNLFAFVIKAKLVIIARCLQPALGACSALASRRVENGPSLDPAAASVSLRCISEVIPSLPAATRKTLPAAWTRHSGHCTTFMQQAECVQAADDPWGADVPAMPSAFNDESPAQSTTCLPPIADGLL